MVQMNIFVCPFLSLKGFCGLSHICTIHTVTQCHASVFSSVPTRVCHWIQTFISTLFACLKLVSCMFSSAPRCCCGQLWQCHRDGSPATLRHGEDLHWSPSRHTQLLPTDAYGILEFQGGAHPTKAHVSLWNNDKLALPKIFSWLYGLCDCVNFVI